MPFSNPAALLGLLSAIPLILIYLIRPKPREIRFSATQFLQEGEAERSAVLSRLINDPLFWVQLLVLCSLSVAAAGPYTEEEGQAGSHLVVVLDSSASMQACWPRALQIIDPYLERYQRISLVQASSAPRTLLQEGGAAEAADALRNARTDAVSADLSAGLALAGSLLGGQGGHILLVSDFVSWTGDDPEETRKVMQAEGKVSIVFADAYQGGDNLAVVEGWDVPGPGYVNHTARIHNFGPAASASITIRGPGGSEGRTAQMGSDGEYYLSFTAWPGVNEIILNVDDAIDWDDHAYVYVPDLAEKRVLYLGRPGPALAALRSNPNLLVTAEDGAGGAATQTDYSGYDLIVLAANSTPDGKINRYVDGGRVIFIASGGAEGPEFLPVRLAGQADGPAALWVRDEGFAGGLHMDEIGLYRYPQAVSRKGSATLVEANGVPVLSYWRLGRGLVVYTGLEMDSDFYMRPEYPIFWYNLVNWITDVPDVQDSNRKTGETVYLGESAVLTTPTTTLTASSLRLDEAGVYSFLGRSIAASMYDPAESSLKRSGGVDAGQFHEVSQTTTVKKDLSLWIIALAALAILLELAVMRWRREA
ncbi:MAG TPA: VWA domain-containing protein [Methanothrix sp.]|nr:VWA domain-containing protein [Methanothrix sp.]HPT18579.1 VWA domain-containing protein [Methanothrix sp.]